MTCVTCAFLSSGRSHQSTTCQFTFVCAPDCACAVRPSVLSGEQGLHHNAHSLHVLDRTSQDFNRALLAHTTSAECRRRRRQELAQQSIPLGHFQEAPLDLKMAWTSSSSTKTLLWSKAWLSYAGYQRQPWEVHRQQPKSPHRGASSPPPFARCSCVTKGRGSGGCNVPLLAAGGRRMMMQPTMIVQCPAGVMPGQLVMVSHA